MRPELMEIVKRRYGPAFEKPCLHASVIVCAYWECQVADACRGLSKPEAPAPFHLAEARAALEEAGK